MESRSKSRWQDLRRHDAHYRTRLSIDRLCGVDEAGRGPLAGPVVAAAVVLPPRVQLPGLDDSKVLDPDTREALAGSVRARARAIGWAVVGPRTIEQLNILRATELAMRRSVLRLARLAEPEFVLIDGHRTVPDLAYRQEAVVDGDAKSLAVAAASVIAKTIRDRIMDRLDRCYPQYGFARHKGYGTPEHLQALEAHGPCPWHRYSFAPVRQADLFPVASQSTTR